MNVRTAYNSRTKPHMAPRTPPDRAVLERYVAGLDPLDIAVELRVYLHQVRAVLARTCSFDRARAAQRLGTPDITYVALEGGKECRGSVLRLAEFRRQIREANAEAERRLAARRGDQS